MACLFIFLTVYINAEVFNLDEIQVIDFLLCFLHFVSYLRNIYITQDHKKFSPIFF